MVELPEQYCKLKEEKLVAAINRFVRVEAKRQRQDDVVAISLFRAT